MRILILIVLFLPLPGILTAQDAREIVKKADEKFRGGSSQGEMTMLIQRPAWSRTISMKCWTLGNDFSMIYITSPAKEMGQVYLKRYSEMWNYVPSIERMIKIPPSMMGQSWMGSDFTNDDLVRKSSFEKDYEHSLLGEEKLFGYNCYKIMLLPREDAAVVWGKIVMWISREDYFWLKGEFYDEEGSLVNTELLSDIRQMDDRRMPTKLEMIPAGKQGQKTILTFDKLWFNTGIKESFFSQLNMRKIR